MPCRSTSNIGSCCTTLRGEVICGPMFDLVVVNRQDKKHVSSTAMVAPVASLEDGAGGKASVHDDSEAEAAVYHRQNLDIIRTFSPRPRLLCITFKIFLAAWILSVLAMSIEQMTYPDFWLAYLTYWGYTLTAMYGAMSPICAIYLALRPPNSIPTLNCCCCRRGGGDGGGGVAGCLVKTTWALLAIVIPAEVVIAILFWTLEYDPGTSVSYTTVMVHGGTMILLLIDGFVVSRIPLRWKQFVFFETFSFLYLLWNIIHAYSGMGNPYNGVSQDDDAIYSSLDWKPSPTKAIIMSVLVLFVANPIIFGICWWLSRVLPLRLLKERNEVEQVEECDEPPKVNENHDEEIADDEGEVEHELVPVVTF